MGRGLKGVGAVLLVVGLVAAANVVAPAGAGEVAGDLRVPAHRLEGVRRAVRVRAGPGPARLRRPSGPHDPHRADPAAGE